MCVFVRIRMYGVPVCIYGHVYVCMFHGCVCMYACMYVSSYVFTSMYMDSCVCLSSYCRVVFPFLRVKSSVHEAGWVLAVVYGDLSVSASVGTERFSWLSLSQ